MYTIGVDFGTLSGRAVLVDTRDGTEVATSVLDYSSAVIDKTLPTTGKDLLPERTLQDLLDYLEVRMNYRFMGKITGRIIKILVKR